MPKTVLPFSALLLSGGASSRFGGQPKALLPVAGRSALRRMAEIALEEGADPVLAVVRPGSARVLDSISGLPVRTLISEVSHQGRTASIQSGWSALPPDRDVLLWPVDHSFVNAKTLRALREARRRETVGRWFIPTFQGRGGHPVLLDSRLGPAIAELGPDEPLRTLRSRFAVEVVRVPVEDPAVTWEIDTPEAYRAACAQEDRWTAR